MPRSPEHQANFELFKEAFYSFQEFVTEAKLSRNDGSEISHGRNVVIWTWEAFSVALGAYSIATDQTQTYFNSGVDEVVKTLTTDHVPDRLLVLTAHQLFKEFTYNDFKTPGNFLAGLKSPYLEAAMDFCMQVSGVGLRRRDIDEIWPILPLDDDLWEAMTQADRDFMKMFVNFQSSWGEVPLSAVDHFPKTKNITSEKQRRYLLNRMQDIGVVVKKPLISEPLYLSSVDNFGFKDLQ